MSNFNIEPPKPDMSILNDSYYALPSLPLYVFPERLQTWLKENETATGAPIDYSAGVILTTCAALIGNSCQVAINPKWYEPSNLLVSLVGVPASGKTPASAPILKLLHELEDYYNRDFDKALAKYHEELELAKISERKWKKDVGEALENHKPKPPKPADAIYPEKPTRVRLFVQDSTSEQFITIEYENRRGVFLSRDELTGWLGSMTRYKGGNSTDRPFWLEAHAGGSFTVDRVKHSDHPIKVKRLGVSILGGIQPDKLKHIVNDDDDGLVARFLYIWPQRGEVVPYTSGADIALIERLFKRLHGDIPCGDNPHTISFTSHGENSFLEFRKRMQHGAQYCSGPLAGVYGKAAGHAARLALVLTLINWALSGSRTVPTEIPYQTQCNAVNLMEHYFLPMAHRVLDNADRPATEAYGRTLAKWLVSNQRSTISKREVYKTERISGLGSANKAQAAIDELVEANWLLPQPIIGENGGRPKDNYLVNPSIYPAE